MANQISRWLAMAKVKAKSREEKRIEQRMCAGKCLYPDCEADHKKRGLCEKHYQLFLRRQSEADDPGQLEEEAIEEGLILPVNDVRKFNRADAFSKLGK